MNNQLFKFAYVRGVQRALIQSGALRKYANEELADEAAMEAAEGMEADPLEEVPAEGTADVAATLLEDLSQQAGEVAETAAAAAEAVEELKAASDYSHMTGEGDVGNSLLHAAGITAEGVQESSNRPEGYAQNAPATQAGDEAQQGVQTKHPGAPTAIDVTANKETVTAKQGSVVELDGRTAAAILRKLAAGDSSTDFNHMTGGDGGEGNDITHAGGVTAEGEQEQDNRPAGYAETAPPVSAPEAQQGVEGAHPGSPTGETLEGKQASAFNVLLRKTASEVGDFLPSSLTANQKLAALRTMIGMTNPERAEYIGRIKSAMDEDEKDEKKDAKKDDDKDDKDDDLPAFLKKDDDEEKSASAILKRLGFGS
jgi:hypothetical protein